MSTKRSPIAKEMPKKFANEKYRLGCSEAYPWFCKAEELKKSARILYDQFLGDLEAFQKGGKLDEPFIGHVALMLYGLAIENLLKSGLAAKGMGTAESGGFNLKSHLLIDLSGRLGVSLSKPETELLERLEGFISWAGRYPIPIHVQDMYPREMADGSKGGIYSVSTLDAPAIELFIEKLYLILPTEEEALISYTNSYHL